MSEQRNQRAHNACARRPSRAWLARTTALLASVWSCADAAEIEHPTPENIPSGTAPLIEAGQAPTKVPMGTDTLRWRQTRDAILNATTVTSIGKVDGDDPDVFGAFVDVTIDDAGVVYVLDKYEPVVRVFDPSGDFVTGFGGIGGGPNEFRRPRAIDRISDGRLLVADRNRQLKVLAPSDSGYNLVDNITLAYSLDELCLSGRRPFARARGSDPKILHEIAIGSDGRNADFGEGYRDSQWLVRDQLSDGRMACLDDPPRVVFGFEFFPFVRAYDPTSGTLLWASKVEDYAQMKIRQGLDQEGPYVSFDSNGTIESLVLAQGLGSDYLLLQFAREEDSGTSARYASEVTYRTYLVDAATGWGAFVSDELPRIVAATQRYYVAAWTDLHPRLEVRRLGDETCC